MSNSKTSKYFPITNKPREWVNGVVVWNEKTNHWHVIGDEPLDKSGDYRGGCWEYDPTNKNWN